MATRRYGIGAGEDNTYVTEGVGAAVNADVFEFTVDLATTYVGNGGTTTRAVNKQEVLRALDKIKEHVLKGNWPPA